MRHWSNRLSVDAAEAEEGAGNMFYVFLLDGFIDPAHPNRDQAMALSGGL